MGLQERSMMNADFLIIGGGIAGLSAAARLARHGRVAVIEGEEAIGYHSSGRSVTFSHFGIGNEAVRALTAWSRSFFEAPPEGFSAVPLYRSQPSLYFAGADQRAMLESLHAGMAEFTDTLRWVDAEEIARICPVLKSGPGAAEHALIDTAGLKLDADALLQSFARSVRAQGGEINTGCRIEAIERQGGGWSVRTEAGGEWNAPILINAAGAWVDRVAEIAGVRPLGLQPLRRTIIVLKPPTDTDVSGWPFVHSIAGDFYMMPEAGRLLVSPVDEVQSDPCDAQPEDYDIALAAWKAEEYTTLSVRHIEHRWAGLRSFVADRVPTAGFAPDAPGFFWLAGQGGYGLQTAPAMAAAAESLVTASAWPEGLAALGVTAETIAPQRLFSSGT